MNNKLAEPCRQSFRHRYQSSLEDMAEADRLAEWLATITLPESFQLAVGVRVVNGRLFRIRLLQDLKETRHTAMFSGALSRARQVRALFPKMFLATRPEDVTVMLSLRLKPRWLALPKQSD